MDISRIKKEDKQKFFRKLSRLFEGELSTSDLESLKSYLSYNENIVKSILKLKLRQHKRVYTQLYEVWKFIPTIQRNIYKNVSKSTFKEFRSTELGKQTLSFFTFIELIRNLSNYDGHFEVKGAISNLSENIIELPDIFALNFDTLMKTVLLQVRHFYGIMYNLRIKEKGYAELINPYDECDRLSLEIFYESEEEIKKLENLLIIECDKWKNLYLILNDKVIKSQIQENTIVYEVYNSPLLDIPQYLSKLMYNRPVILPLSLTDNIILLQPAGLAISLETKEKFKDLKKLTPESITAGKDKEKSNIYNKIESYLNEALCLFRSIGTNNKKEDELLSEILFFVKNCYPSQLSNRGALMITGCIAAQLEIFDTEDTYSTSNRSTYSNYLYTSVSNRLKRNK